MKKLLILLFPVAMLGCSKYAKKHKTIYWVDCADGNRYRCPQPKPCKCPEPEGLRFDHLGENEGYYGQCPPDDTTAVKQEVFFSPLLNKYVLVTNMGSMYDNVVHGTIQYILQQKPIEYANALRRKKPVATIEILCK